MKADLKFEAAGPKPLPALGPGSVLGLFAPGSPTDEAELAAGEAVLNGLGFSLVKELHAPGPWPYLAGEDEARAEALNRLAADPAVAGLICLRGGYGCLRCAGHIDFEALAKSAKPLIGFSDCTVLLAGLLKAGRCSIHGPTLSALAYQTTASLARLADLLGGGWAEAEPLTGVAAAGQGRARGYLVGGNLTVLAHLIGTPFQPPTAGGIIFFEDTGEPLYRLDRAMTHLLEAGFFEGCAGVAAGRFNGVEAKEALGLVAERLDRLHVPVLGGLPFGHGPDNMSLLVGALAEIDLEAGSLSAAA